MPTKPHSRGSKCSNILLWQLISRKPYPNVVHNVRRSLKVVLLIFEKMKAKRTESSIVDCPFFGPPLFLEKFNL